MTPTRRLRISGLAVALAVLVSLLVPGLQSTASASTSSGTSPASTSARSGDTQLRAGATTQRSKAAKKRAKVRAAKARAAKVRAAKARAAKVRAAKVRAAKVRAAKARAAKAQAAKAAAAAKAKADAEAKARADAAAKAEAEKNRPADLAAFRLANANIKNALSAADFSADLRSALAHGPDAVTLNEVAGRTTQQLTPAGYGSYRPTDRRIKANAVLWRLDRWQAVAQGEIYLLDGGPQSQDNKRGATWVTLSGLHGQGTVSVVSTHHMVNPAKFGPDKPLRQQLYAQGMERLRLLVEQLSTSGPVFVAGDFNSGFQENRTWSPRNQFAPIGVKAAMESTGKLSTHDGGGSIDYVFYQSSRASVTGQTVTNLRSDHHLLVNDFQILPPAPPAEEPTPTNGSTPGDGSTNGSSENAV